MNSRQGFLRLTGCCFALALACLFAQPASAAVMHAGTFTENDPGAENEGDTFTITNNATAGEDILTVVIDLTLSPDVVFDTSTGPPATFSGFDSADPYASFSYTGTKGLSILFNADQLNPGDTFTFTIDVDDTVALVTGFNIAGSTVQAFFDSGGDVTAALSDAGGNAASWTSPVPEPNTLALLGLGLTGLAWGGRRRR
jgi:hypothetical protein